MPASNLALGYEGKKISYANRLSHSRFAVNFTSIFRKGAQPTAARSSLIRFGRWFYVIGKYSLKIFFLISKVPRVRGKFQSHTNLPRVGAFNANSAFQARFCSFTLFVCLTSHSLAGLDKFHTNCR